MKYENGFPRFRFVHQLANPSCQRYQTREVSLATRIRLALLVAKVSDCASRVRKLSRAGKAFRA